MKTAIRSFAEALNSFITERDRRLSDLNSCEEKTVLVSQTCDILKDVTEGIDALIQKIESEQI